MEINNICNKWKNSNFNKKASMDLWDSMAESFNKFTVPTAEDSQFLKIVWENNMIDSNFQVLDVGCGSGRYSIALSNLCENITGIDLSPKMIENANNNKEAYKASNAEFYCEDWSDFDLVFAHMTPAVNNAETFEKLSKASRKYCVLCKPTRRTDPVSDKVKELVGISKNKESCDMDIAYAFEMLWLQGYEPKVEYEKQVWHMEKTLEEAFGLYINRVKSYKEITLEEEAIIKKYLESICKDKIVSEEVNTTIATIYWQV
ncbi:class I SAM-dependent methyltransferase [Terrisporobacter mayombei]|uniref:Ubiquinone biosynthesis O-methyltransferase, mitochondrial n=1 Tax=Terrisporobacter mayombei TaxID=1541 RepID=A0ABY9Q700_9FIRM|nr:class I SAM-dependent methyltransferase [Terrisporobacter mayombei]MCC3868858.1 class I SAM-dependent methyltransferase [Terrisporobacter mayombei]WMT83010.1 Ubiquinone biosynthesis O-methyltransferase, mitochondrial [Terrisporobacter mayombei]